MWFIRNQICRIENKMLNWNKWYYPLVHDVYLSSTVKLVSYPKVVTIWRVWRTSEKTLTSFKGNMRCQTQEAIRPDAAVWLEEWILPDKPVDECFVIPFSVLKQFSQVFCLPAIQISLMDDYFNQTNSVQNIYVKCSCGPTFYRAVNIFQVVQHLVNWSTSHVFATFWTI